MSLQERLQKYMADLDREVLTHSSLPRPFFREFLSTDCCFLWQLSKYPSVVQFERKAGVSKVFLALGIGFIYFFLIFLNYGGQILSNLVGFIFPGTPQSPPSLRHLCWYVAYESMKAIESAGTADDTQWLTYWVVFSFFNVVEYWSRTILYWLRMSLLPG